MVLLLWSLFLGLVWWCTFGVKTRAKVSVLSLFIILYCLAPSTLAVPELVVKAIYSMSVIVVSRVRAFLRIE